MIGIMTGTNGVHIQLLYQLQVIHHNFTSLSMTQTVVMFMSVDTLYISRNAIH